jgi:AcrR family transcriptional regulator
MVVGGMVVTFVEQSKYFLCSPMEHPPSSAPEDTTTPVTDTGTDSAPPGMRDRIVREASRLFAGQGVKATTVAQIEVGVGLRKGSGGVHRYFASKDDLVDAVFAAQLAGGREVRDEAVAIPPPTADGMDEYLTAIGTKILRDSERSREVSLIMLREAGSLRESVRRHALANDAVAYQFMADSLRVQMSSADPSMLERFDPEALAFLFVGSMIFFKLTDWLTGEPKLGLTDDRLLRTWVNVFSPVLQAINATSSSPPVEP